VGDGSILPGASVSNVQSPMFSAISFAWGQVSKMPVLRRMAFGLFTPMM
jgi:hypothetical protein